MTVAQLEKIVMNLEKELTVLVEQMKGAFHRIDEQKKLAESVQKLAISVSEQTTELKQMRKDMDNFRKDVDELKSKPARRWEAVAGQITALIIAAVFGALIMKFGG